MAGSKGRYVTIDRRDLLKLGAGAALASTLTALPERVVLAQEAQVHRFAFGDVEIIVLSDGIITFPIGNLATNADQGALKGLLTAHDLPVDEHVSQINVAAIKTADDLILIDTGSGINFMSSAGLLVDSFDAAGIDPEDVTKVILTHAHPDHVWGIIDDFDESERFGNAEYFMRSSEWDFWMADDVLTKLPESLHGFALGAKRNLDPIAEKVTRVNNNASVVPGVTMIDTPGHTPGHMSVVVDSDKELLVVTGDAVTHKAVSFERPDWRFVRDQDPDMAVKTRKRLLDMIATDGMRLVGYHLPWPGVGVAETNNGSWRFVSESS